MRYLIGIHTISTESGYEDVVTVSEFDPSKIPGVSGVFWLVVTAESKDEAREIGKKNWERYKEGSKELAELGRKLSREVGVLGYHDTTE